MNYAKVLVVLSFTLISSSAFAASGENHIQYTPDGYVVKIKQSGDAARDEASSEITQGASTENHTRTPSNFNSDADAGARDNSSRGTH